LPEFRIEVKCSRGLYIRTLAEEIGEKLGVPSHLSGLRRDAIGRFTIEMAVSTDDFDALTDMESPGYSLTEALAHLPVLEMTKRESASLINGVVPSVPMDMDISPGDIICLLRFDKTLGGIGKISLARTITIKRVFNIISSG
jgi:tRNA pseudouridine55 synthase